MIPERGPQTVFFILSKTHRAILLDKSTYVGVCVCVCVSVSVCCDVRRMVVLITQVDARSVASRASYRHCSGLLCSKALAY